MLSSTSCVSGSSPCSTHTSPMDSTSPVKCRMSPSSSMNSGVTARRSMSPRCTLTRYRPLSPRSVATGWSITGDLGATTAPTASESSIMPSSFLLCAASALLAPPGSRNGDAMRMYAIPLSATGTPYTESANRPIGCTSGYRSRIMPSTTRLVDVPISVHVPPNMLANDRGIISCELGMFTRRLHFCRMGIMMATTGVLLRNALTNATGTMSRICALATFLGVPSSLPM
mmetsp:Transcript_8080/g.34334  ORF Transcript_8080/g.34334 Transcript_8080/m.34334 type:complete len:229 (-) Transcript_8080:477-1163(-)